LDAEESEKSDLSSSDDTSVQQLSLSSDSAMPASASACCEGVCSCVQHGAAASALIKRFEFCEGFVSNPFCTLDC